MTLLKLLQKMKRAAGPKWNRMKFPVVDAGTVLNSHFVYFPRQVHEENHSLSLGTSEYHFSLLKS